MACEFHARLSISILYTSSFILEPNKCLSPLGVSAHKSATTSVCGEGVRADGEVGRRGGEEGVVVVVGHCTLTCEDEKWQWAIAARGTRSFGVDGSAIMAGQPDNIIPFPFSVSSRELERLQGSALFLPPQNQKQQQQQVPTGLRGSICTGKHLTSTS